MATRTNNLKLSKAEVSDAIKSTLTANNNNFDKLDDVITRLKANQISGTASGTEIEIADSANMESVLKVHGNSEQATRSGKNVANLLEAGAYNSTLAITNSNNLTATVNSANQGAGAFCYFRKSDGSYLTVEEVLNKEIRATCTFTKSRNELKPRISIMEGAGGPGTNEYNQRYGSGEICVHTFTKVNSSFPYVGIFLGMQSTTSGAVLTIGDNVKYSNVIATIDNEDMTFEPYGAMPSPEFESPIMSVKSKSDNLFDSDYSLVTKGGFVKQDDGSYYLASVNQVANIWENTEGYTGQFSLSLECKWENETNGRGEIIRIHYTDGTFTDFMTNAAKGNKKWGSFVRTTEKNKVVQSLSTSWGNARRTYFRNIMFNKGDKALPYQLYGYVPAEARVEGRNIAEIKAGGNVYVTDGTCTQGTADTKTDIQWKVEGRLEAKFVKSFASYVDNSLGVKVRSFVKDDSFDRLYIGLNGSTKDTLIYIPVDNLINGETYTVQWNVLNATQGSVSWNNVQLEKGATATPFVNPPKTISLPLGDIELRSTPDGTRDTFARVDGVWNKVSNIESVVFDGNETWYEGSFPVEGSIQYQYKISNAKASTPLICNRFVNERQINGIIYGSTCNIYMDENYGFLSGQFKEWLANNPTEVVYQLATPTYTPITDQGLISALDELEQLILHKGYNRITVTGVNGVKAYLDLNYYKDINIVLDNINTKLGGV